MGCLSHAFTRGRKRGGAIDRLESQSTLSALHGHVDPRHVKSCMYTHLHNRASVPVGRANGTRKVEGLMSNFRLFLAVAAGGLLRYTKDRKKGFLSLMILVESL